MLAVVNDTPLQTALFQATDVNQDEYAVVAIKGTFTWKNSSRLLLAEEQQPIFYADVPYDEDQPSSVKYASDICLLKSGCDVALVGNAYAHRNPVTQLDVQLSVGPLHRIIRIYGDRYFKRHMGIWRITQPEKFIQMPLVWERAYGGSDTSHPNPKHHSVFLKNPIGSGYCKSGRKEKLEGLKVANIESISKPIASWKDCPEPQGFGFIGRDWEPRAQYMGTYDDQWKQDRCPLLPLDFDPRYYNAVHPSMIIPGYLSGGEEVSITNVSKKGDVHFSLPQLDLKLESLIQGQLKKATCILDTVLIEPDEERVCLTWRARFGCTRKFLYVEYVWLRATGLDGV